MVITVVVAVAIHNQPQHIIFNQRSLELRWFFV
jgi:hypothetical protein